MQTLFVIFWVAVLTLLPAGVFSLMLHFLLSIPMRRRDRARFFLDLLSLTLDRGQSVERTVLSAAETRDRIMGVPFYLFSAHIENGQSFGGALEKVPGFLPPPVNAILRAGERLGNLKKVLPAAREVLRLAPDTTRTTMSYMVAILMVFAPIAILLISLISTFVLPKLQAMAAGLGIKIWPLTQFVFALNKAHILIDFEAVLFCLLAIAAAVYLGGPGLVRFFQFRKIPIIDWIAWKVPWKQKKLQRIFSAMLAVMLDGGMPEAEAVKLAGESTANEICRRRSRLVVAELERGVKLEKAVRRFDDTGEFQWRLTNATHARNGFLQALEGWHESLDAKAFQQEETAAQAMTSGLVILNGVVVGLMATAVFGMIVMILRGALDAT